MTEDLLPIRPVSIDALGALLQHYQASITIDYLYDHGWQVVISNPGGSLYVHGGTPEKPEQWSHGGEPSLTDTIAEAATRAVRGGWL